MNHCTLKNLDARLNEFVCVNLEFSSAIRVSFVRKINSSIYGASKRISAFACRYIDSKKVNEHTTGEGSALVKTKNTLSTLFFCRSFFHLFLFLRKVAVVEDGRLSKNSVKRKHSNRISRLSH